MKKEKLITAIVLLVALLVPFTGCGTDTPETTAPKTTTAAVVSPEVTTEPVQTELPIETTTFAATEGTVSVPGDFAVHFIDVGQADAALVLCDGQAMLIDGGNVEDSSVLYTYLKKWDISYLDYVVGTHAHEDHIGGIAGALNYASVETVFCPVTSHTTKAFENFVKAVEKHGAQITVPQVGTTYSLGSAVCEILAVNTESEENNSSIVLRITYGETSFLFTGDSERPVEEVILDRGEDVRSTVLKVGHHGSESSTSYRWLREVAPQYAVISVGKDNSYGHPTEEVLSRLRDAQITTFRTDMQGDIICTSDGRTVSFQVTRNKDADVFGQLEGSVQQTQPTEAPTVPITQAPTEQTQATEAGTHYVVNTNSKKFHYDWCDSVDRMKEENKMDFYGTDEELEAQGYVPCKNCDP